MILIIVLSAPFNMLGGDSENTIEKYDCCGLGNIFYGIAKYTGRNDFLYLAHANCTWFLQKKIESSEHTESLDRYYLRFGQYFNVTDVSLHHTPLHEAVKMGNLEVVKLLCAFGSDKQKKIKSAQELVPDDFAIESYPVTVYRSWPIEKEEEEIAKFKKKLYVGCNSIELACCMLEKSEDKHNERKAIKAFLEKQNKKDQ